uniref:Uncharacterized protein n=1 Tax=Fagus sylvatica TaxID=28930 RepID=A0A2N9FQ06_FAGSY
MEEEAVSENNPGDARLPTFNHRRIRSEVRAPRGQRGREERRSYGRIEGRHHSPSKEPSFLGEARKKRRIEELEEELRFLKEEDKEKGDQRQRKRSRSHLGSCGSSKHAPSHKEHNRKSKHRHQRSVSPKRRKLDHPKTPPHQRQHNPIWKKLRQISSSPFSAEIERPKFPARFVPPNLAIYDGKSDPVGHLSRYRQSMAIHTSNDPLMCHIFPSSLGEVGLRWFDRLDHRSIRSWQEMSESFTARFITNTRKPKEIDALLALKMKAGETLKSYSARYWEVYNDIDACDKDIVVKTFWFGLNEDIKLRRSLTKRPPLSMADLMTRLEEHIRVEDDPKSSARTVEAAPPVDKRRRSPSRTKPRADLPAPPLHKGLQPPRNVREVQRLTGMAAALNRFISKSAEKCRPFFDLIKKGKNFAWNEESDRAFERLKRYLSTPPLLSSPKEGEPLYIYLAASDKAVSAAIVRNGPGEQRPVYYTSKTMNGAETRYLPLEKSALALFIIAKKLPHYFQAHTMIVLTSLPLKALFRSSDFSGRISKWGAHLGAYDVRYRPRTSIKGQVLADFVAEFAPEHSELPTIEEHPRSAEQVKGKNWWTLYVDGAANSRGSGLGIVLISSEGEMLEQAVRLGFRASNNEAEYEALLHGLRAAKRLGARFLNIRFDSQLIVNQLTGEYMAKDERMMAYRDLAKDLLKSFDEVNIERVGREHNGHADSLVGLASSVAPDFRRTIAVEVQDSPSIMKSSPAIICQIEAGPSWMDPILNYLTKDVLPADQKETAKIRRNATRSMREYAVVTQEDDLAHRAIGQGYWWPYMQKDAAQYVRRCEKCQLFAPAIHKPASQLNPISSPWPFAQWGLDLVGPLPRATGNRQWLIVATDYFTKWVEAEPLARITDSESRKFIWKNIITHFGIPRCLISDNGTQFDSGPFKKYCSEFGIRNHFFSPAYPQGNGQAESFNKTILNGIKKRLEEAKGRWVEELPTILWTFRTTPRSSTGETPFSLTYGVEAVIPLEVRLPTLRSEEYDRENNELMLARDMDLAQERRDLAMIRLASYQGDLKKKYGRSINARSLAPGDMVLRRVLGSKRDPSQGKLGANWEGPYQVVSEAGLGAFNLKGMDGKPLRKPWNISNLKRYCKDGGAALKSWPRPGALPVKPQVVWQSNIKTLAMLGVSPVNPQVVWRNGIKILATPRCSAYETSSGALPVKPQVVWQSNIKTLAMLGVSPVNPQVVWRNGIKILATPRCSACETSSGMAEQHQNPSHARCPAYKSSSGTVGRQQNPGHA